MIRCKKYITIGIIVVVTALSFQTIVLPLRALVWAMASVTFAEINLPTQLNEIEEIAKKKISADSNSVPDHRAPIVGFLEERLFAYSSTPFDSPPVPPPDH